MRREDRTGQDYSALRAAAPIPEAQVVLEPGNVLIPSDNIAIMAVVASTVVVTLYDRERKRGGICHFVQALPDDRSKATPMFGLHATAALIRGFMTSGSKTEALEVGLYGGAWPEWSNAAQREKARHSVEVVRDVMRKKNLPITDEDVGGHRGRKILYVTGTNEIAVLKTTKIRESDWFPADNIGRRGK